MKNVFIVLAVMLMAGLVGCTSTKPVAKVQGRPVVVASQENVAKAKAIWQADPKNAAKRQAYDDAVAAQMEKVGKAK